MKRSLRDMAKKVSGGKEPSKEQMDELRNQAKKYEGKSESDLLNELAANYQRGALSDQELQQFVEQAGPMLSPAQMQKLQSIIGRIRRG